MSYPFRADDLYDRRARYPTFLKTIPKTTEQTRNIDKTDRTPRDDKNQMHMSARECTTTKNDRTHERDANTRGRGENTATTVGDDDAGRTAAARSRNDSVRLTGRPVSCRSPSTAFIAGGWHRHRRRWVRGGRDSESALALSRSQSPRRRSRATTRTRTCDRKDGFFKVFPTARS